MAKLKDIVPKDMEMPEIFSKGEFTQISAVLDKPLVLVDYMLYESKKDIYDADNKTGIAILAEDTKEKKLLRISTHAKALVRDIQKTEAEGIDPRGSEFTIIEKLYKGKKIMVFD